MSIVSSTRGPVYVSSDSIIGLESIPRMNEIASIDDKFVSLVDILYNDKPLS